MGRMQGKLESICCLGSFILYCDNECVVLRVKNGLSDGDPIIVTISLNLALRSEVIMTSP